jgi:hypothetical protein
MIEPPFDRVWHWKSSPMHVIDRKGQACRILVVGGRNSILVEFEDGFKVVTSRHAVRYGVTKRG